MDSLPYVDSVTDEYRQYALALIDHEMKTTTTKMDETFVRDSIPNIQFRTELMKIEYEALSTRISEGKTKKMEGDDESISKTIQLQKPSKNDMLSKVEWEKAIRTARIAYETERIRAMNLEINKEGIGSLTDHWKSYNEFIMVPTQQGMNQQLQSKKRKMEDINYFRQKEQQTMGQELHTLTNQYRDSISQHLQLVQATNQLKAEIEEGKKM